MTERHFEEGVKEIMIELVCELNGSKLFGYGVTIREMIF